MFHLSHCQETEEHEDRSVWEEHLIADAPHKSTGEDRCHDLRRHGRGIVITCKFAYVRASAHLDHHRQRVDVDGRPCESDQRKHDEHNGIYAVECRRQEESREETCSQQNDTYHYGLLAAYLMRKASDRYV